MTKPTFSTKLFIILIPSTTRESLREFFAKCRNAFSSLFKTKKEKPHNPADTPIKKQFAFTINPNTQELEIDQIKKLATIFNANPNGESIVSEGMEGILNPNKNRTKSQIQSQVESQIKNKVALNQEIGNFNKFSLKKLIVHNVSDSPMPHFPKTHSYIVIANATKTHQKSYGNVVYCGGSIMHQPFTVAHSIVWSVQRSKAFSAPMKAAIKTLKNQEFPSAEHFLRAVLTEKAKRTNETISQEDLYAQAANPNKELQRLIYLQSSGLNNGKKGAILPLNANSGRRLYDRKKFENGESANKLYPNIDPMIVHDVFQQQQLFANYMDEKAGIGKETAFETKLQTKEAETSRLMQSLVRFSFLPKSDHTFTANCNKATATLLQEAENLSAKKQNRKPEHISAASSWGFGANQRMFLWNPLNQSIKNVVLSLIGKDHISQATSTMSLESLANRKHDIFAIICTLPLAQQEQALKQALNLDETKKGNALSQIFNHKDTSASFYKHTSLHNLYYLHKLKHRLNTINFEINKVIRQSQGDESHEAQPEPIQPKMGNS